MEHVMRLNPQPFSMIKSGEKIVELRLYDEKRKRVRACDTVRFIHTENGEQLLCRVKALHLFSSFKELYASLPLQKCGYTEETVCSADPADMEKYYSKAEQETYGVVGIEIEVIQ